MDIQGTGDSRGGDAKGLAVQLANGQAYIHVVDLTIPGRGLDYRFEREYRSQISYDGPLGYNWDHTYNMRLRGELDGNGFPTGNIFLLNGLGRRDFYVRQSDGSYTSPRGHYRKLIKNLDGTFVLREPDGMKSRFTTMDTSLNRAFLTAIIDRNQNQLSFSYNSQRQLTQVIDTLGRSIQYTYNLLGRLDHITDFSGRTLRFQYDVEGNLVSVTSPPVFGTPSGNDFPAGKTIKYTYSANFSDARLNHNLLTITRPNEVALEPDGPPVLINTYGTDPNKPYEVDKLLSETFGGLNAAAAARGLSAAGGRLTFFYQELNSHGNPADLTIPRNRTTVVDRAGNVAAYQQNVLGANVSYKEFTGRVNPALSRAALQALIPSNNPSFPPIAKLRSSDPSFFETLYEYNADGECTRTTDPEGSSVQRTFDSANPDGFQHGNVLESRRIAGPRGGDGAGGAIDDIVTTYTYEPIYDQIKTVTDPRGQDPTYVPPINPSDANVVGIDFDEDGTITPAERRRARYSAVSTFDYQESTTTQILALAASEGVQLTLAQARLLSLGDTVATDVNGDGLTIQSQGNVVRAQRPTAQLAGGSSQAIVTLWRCNSRGQLLARVDPDQSVDQYLYYPASNPHGGGGVPPDADTVSELGGYLGRIVEDTTTSDNADGAALNITTEYRYDPVGNVISILDGRGIRRDFIVNQLNQVVKAIRAADVSSSPEAGLLAFAYGATSLFDANDNLVEEDVENRDGNTDGNPMLTTTYAYDILDDCIETGREVSPTKTLLSSVRYDANENPARTIRPLGNFHDAVHDERDLVYTRTTGADNPSISATYRFTYDGDRNLKIARDAEDTDGVGGEEESLSTYDGFGRLVRSLDPVGNETLPAYDPAGNEVALTARGRIGGASPTNNSTAANVELARVSFTYDELNRLTRSDADWFVPVGVTPARAPILVSDGERTTFMEYDPKSRVIRRINDNNHATTCEYDGADRLVRTVDALQNEALFAYDNDGNLVQRTTIERRGDNPAVAPETFVTINRYDALSRLILTSDNLHQTRRAAYDSRGNVTWESDAQGPVDFMDPQLGLTNRSGNTVRYFHDGISRRTEVIQDLRLGGSGDGTPSLGGPADPTVDPGNLDTTNPSNPDGKITETFVWDDDSRLQSVADDNGNTTSYLYDSLNRRTRESFADGTANLYVYDRESNVRQRTDENGSVFTYAHDAINRLTETSIARAAGIEGTVLQTYQYDGLRRRTRATDDNDPNTTADDSVVTFLYDSLSRRLEESQDGQIVTGDFDGLGNRIRLTYPNGRQVGAEFDALERLEVLDDLRLAEPINDTVTYSYIGPSRVLERTYVNGTKLTYLDNSSVDVGYDGTKRIIRHRHETASDGTIADFTYGHNRQDMRLFERRLHQPVGGDAKGEAYAYDSLYRLFDFKVGTQTAGGTIATPDSQTLYTLDGVGNRTSTDVNGSVAAYVANNMNEYDLVDLVPNAHDADGNLQIDGFFYYVHDALNRLVRVDDFTNGLTLARHTYDALNRRVTKTVSNSGTLDGTYRFLWDGWREIEERDGGNAVSSQFLYGNGLDDVLTMERGGQTSYYHADSLGSIEALTNAAGSIVERTTYDAYGAPRFTDSLFRPRPGSAVGNPILFTGRRLDAEADLYFFRNRYYDSFSGRFIERNPVGYAAGSLGLHEYAGSNVVNRTDPMGLQEPPAGRQDPEGGNKPHPNTPPNPAPGRRTVMSGGCELGRVLDSRGDCFLDRSESSTYALGFPNQEPRQDESPPGLTPPEQDQQRPLPGPSVDDELESIERELREMEELLDEELGYLSRKRRCGQVEFERMTIHNCTTGIKIILDESPRAGQNQYRPVRRSPGLWMESPCQLPPPCLRQEEPSRLSDPQPCYPFGWKNGPCLLPPSYLEDQLSRLQVLPACAVDFLSDLDLGDAPASRLEGMVFRRDLPAPFEKGKHVKLFAFGDPP